MSGNVWDAPPDGKDVVLRKIFGTDDLVWALKVAARTGVDTKILVLYDVRPDCTADPDGCWHSIVATSIIKAQLYGALVDVQFLPAGVKDSACLQQHLASVAASIVCVGQQL